MRLPQETKEMSFLFNPIYPSVSEASCSSELPWKQLDNQVKLIPVV